MKRLLIAIIFCLAIVPAMATHIVGGEFELIFKGIHPNGQFRYTLSLILYFDKINGAAGARDNFATIRIFRKRDNIIMRDNVNLGLVSSSEVGYYKPECSSGNSIRTDRIYYTYMVNGQPAEILLNSNEYADPSGYYMVWERCCRNYDITNIYSQNPETGALYAGQTFYLEFPPLLKNGEPFINSSPSLFPPLSDYACVNRSYWVRFNGTDPDGDSLVYTLVTPLNTKSGDAVPPGGLPRPAPYTGVLYRPGFGPTNFMRGNPDLRIDKKGVLTVTPTVAGLFVFAVKCEEFRDGVKIGEIRRDFQMLVLANCPTAQKPSIEAKKKTESTANFVKGQLNAAFAYQTADEDRCVDIRVTDPDASSRQEKVKILAVSVDFDKDVDEVLPAVPTATLSGSDPALFTVCFPQCPYKKTGPYKIAIIVEDDSCPLPLTDTITLQINVAPPPNESPVFNQKVISRTLEEGDAIPVFSFVGTDADLDNLRIFPPAASVINLQQYGFVYSVNENVPGQIKAQLTWDTRCDVIDFSKKTDFEFSFVLDDQDKCEITPADTLTFKLKIDLVNITPPIIEYVPQPISKEITLTKKIYETISFRVKGYDADANDQLVLKGKGLGFNMADYNATFPTKTFIKSGDSQFDWYLNCDKINLKAKNEFAFEFEVVDDKNKCGYYLSDTLHVTVKVEPPDNLKPSLTLAGRSNDFSLDYTLGEEIRLPALGFDSDTNPSDLLTLALIDAQGTVMPEGYTFTSSPQRSNVSGTFLWKPGCEIFQGKNYENDYIFKFNILDDRCRNIKGDTIELKIKLKDVESEAVKFLPPNIVTPNNDGKNDFFAMLGVNDNNEIFSILPKDNCDGVFVRISIYNRWGREVFESTDRDFKWYPKDDPTGVYFYQLFFTNKEYKGIVSVANGSQ